ncbi:MAG TPA: NAD-dependent epimerase/dehydratase family protein [Candidatus Melainabacteria bacterium]|jgi:nucleoside-diphosphate-sugar epimerase|nr:NAD-dependent epimerase/dehydratase family protein [Candidatus Melainabacteria bacterium]HIN65515.1 NAD-dependent epimerase/dehydratase family protein [Candidatus Obscuribacterales bacterium]
MAKRVLVTGGAGFIGSHQVEALLQRGYDVVAFDSLTMGKRDWVPAKAELVEGDIRDLEACRRAMKGCTGVFHLAAMSRSAASLDNVDICTSNNIIGTQHVLTAAREEGVSKVIYAGSSTYYGNQKPPHKEDMAPDFLNFYGLSKYVGEEYCRLFDKTYNVPCNVMRYFNVYGPRLSGEGAYALVMTIFLKQLRAGKPLTIHGEGLQSRDFIHVRDVARANILAFESPLHGRTYNVGSGTAVTVKELANRISTNQIHEDRRAGDAEITLADISRIKEELGWSPEISFEDGMKELLQEQETAAQQAKAGAV